MSQRPNNLPPTTLPEQEALYRRSKYQRPKSPISIWALVLAFCWERQGGYIMPG